MAKKKKKGRVGSWAFLLGVILAILFAFVSSLAYLWILVVLGIVIGLLNITSNETSKFLLAGTVLVVVGYFGGSSLAYVNFLPEVFKNLVTLFATSTIVVALKSVFDLAGK
jgi:hypothetical protein